jgi:hypothetical protein
MRATRSAEQMTLRLDLGPLAGNGFATEHLVMLGPGIGFLEIAAV